METFQRARPILNDRNIWFLKKCKKCFFRLMCIQVQTKFFAILYRCIVMHFIATDKCSTWVFVIITLSTKLIIRKLNQHNNNERKKNIFYSEEM